MCILAHHLAYVHITTLMNPDASSIKMLTHYFLVILAWQCCKSLYLRISLLTKGHNSKHTFCRNCIMLRVRNLKVFSPLSLSAPGPLFLCYSSYKMQSYWVLLNTWYTVYTSHHATQSVWACFSNLFLCILNLRNNTRIQYSGHEPSLFCDLYLALAVT